MFQVMYPPYTVEGASPAAHCLLAWVSLKGVRVIVQFTARSDEKKKEQAANAELLAEDLNNPGNPIGYKFLLLKSIRDAWMACDAAQEEQKRGVCLNPRESPFMYDRSAPGQGGSGFDGYW